MSDNLTPDELLVLRYAAGQIDRPERNESFHDAYQRMKERDYITYELIYLDDGDYDGDWMLSAEGRAALEAATK